MLRYTALLALATTMLATPATAGFRHDGYYSGMPLTDALAVLQQQGLRRQDAASEPTVFAMRPSDNKAVILLRHCGSVLYSASFDY